MQTKPLVLAALTALFAVGPGIASASDITVRSGSASCQTRPTEPILDELNFSIEKDAQQGGFYSGSDMSGTRFSITYSMKIGKQKYNNRINHNAVDCEGLYATGLDRQRNELAKERLELERLRLEIQQMRKSMAQDDRVKEDW
jgi:hypothetical protein